MVILTGCSVFSFAGSGSPHRCMRQMQSLLSDCLMDFPFILNSHSITNCQPYKCGTNTSLPRTLNSWYSLQNPIITWLYPYTLGFLMQTQAGCALTEGVTPGTARRGGVTPSCRHFCHKPHQVLTGKTGKDLRNLGWGGSQELRSRGHHVKKESKSEKCRDLPISCAKGP